MTQPDLLPPTKSAFLCPGCQQPLNVEPAQTFAPGVVHVSLWCGCGPCPSEAANQGAVGETEAQALNRLRIAVENEPEELE